MYQFLFANMSIAEPFLIFYLGDIFFVGVETDAYSFLIVCFNWNFVDLFTTSFGAY